MAANVPGSIGGMFPFPGFAPGARPEPPPEPAADLLFTPFRLGGVEISNRIAMAPMGTGLASPRGRPTERLIAWYAARAAGGTGLVIVEGTQVLPFPEGEGRAVARKRLALAEDGAVPGFRRLAMAIRRAGAQAAIQLTHTVRSAGEANALALADLAAIVQAFGTAARRASAAGFEAVEIQASYGSVLAQLLSPVSNRRRGRYGRSPEGRLRALLEAVQAVRAAVRPDFPVLVRLSADEYLSGGTTPEQVV